MDTNVGMTSQDWIGVIMASNEAALQWASMYTNRPVPTSQNVFSMSPTGLSVGASGQWILIGALALVALFVFKK